MPFYFYALSCHFEQLSAFFIRGFNMNLNDIVKIQDVDLKGKTILMRVDYNVPLKDGKVDNPKRITATEKTIKYLLSIKC